MSDLSKKIYTAALLNVMGFSNFDKFLFVEVYEKNKQTYSGRVKKYIIKMMYFIQSDSTLKLFFILSLSNCLYEQWLNKPTSK